MSQTKTVYVCDDDQWILDTVVDIISSLKLDILTFASGKLALDQISKNKPDLVITDINMPEMTGLELLKFLETNKFQIPVVMLTGSLDTGNLREAVAYSHFDYLNKPIQPFELIETVQKALSFGYQESQLSEEFRDRLKKG
ncbi:MAG: hypothetical protein B7Y39_05225 [Bdellovibrio sp. 28-41-41]|nr:MAG: hypothetical protein B7Y39_05225 [Bdellovibrio sp. 28-41-41]